MKERVLHSLLQLSLLPHTTDPKICSILLPQLITGTGLAESEIGVRAARVLKLILHNYTDFAIGTIDAFSHRIIRSFAHDFGLPVQFNVELDATELITIAVDLLLDRVGEDADLTRFLVRFLEVRMDEERDWNIDRILVNFARALLDEEGQENIRALRLLSLEDFTRISENNQKKINGFEKLVRKIGTDAMDLILGYELGPGSFHQGNKGVFKYFEYLSEGRSDKFQPNSYVLRTVSEDKWASGKATTIEKSRIETIKPDLARLLEEIIQLLDQSQETYMLHKLLSKTIFPLAVLNEIDKSLIAFKKQHNLIHISEFNLRISSVVMKEPVPFIYERLGERYRHLMIDEFQDTSRLQWQNFIPLIENALAGGYFNLVVGDGKQAIYRWRNGDVTQFTQLPMLQGSDQNLVLRQRQQALENHFKEEVLKENFRSRREIVEFNNGFFRFLETALDELTRKVYQGLEQEVYPGNTGGYIQIGFFQGKTETATLESWNFQEILSIVHQALQDGYDLKDMAILCRKNVQASKLARMLMEAGIDVISSESLLLSQSPDVNFLVSMIRFLFEQENPINQAELAGFLIQSGRLPGMDWPEVLNRIISTSRNGDGLIKLMKDHGLVIEKEELLTLPIYDLCETLIRIFSFDSQVNPYLQFFLDAVLSFTTRDVHGITDFLEWWEEKKSSLSVIVPEGIDAIRVMTIHKSKGLQFPLVIFPFAIESKRLTHEYLWVDLRDHQIQGLNTALLKVDKTMEKTAFRKQYQEEDEKSMLDLVNLLYVVMTRPEERLYILTSKPPEKTLDLNSIPAFFTGYLQEMNLWSDEVNNYQFGRPKLHENKHMKRREPPLLLKSFISEDWRRKIKIRSRAPEIWDMENPLGKINFGNQVHTLLSKIHTRADIETAINASVSQGLIGNEDIQSVMQMLNGMMSHPEIGLLYSDQVKVKTEPEILLPDGSAFRPDRVVFINDQPVVVEFKTGKKEEKHIRQIEKYEDLLKAMGYSGVKKYLVYLHEEVEVMEIR